MTAPMLLMTVPSFSAVDFSGKYGSVIAQPKLDGVWVQIVPDYVELSSKTDKRLGNSVVTRAVTRSGLYVPNAWVRAQLDKLPAGLQGELVVASSSASGEASFAESMSGIASRSGEPNVKFVVFNYVSDGSAEYLALPYSLRLLDAQRLLDEPIAELIASTVVTSAAQLEQEFNRLVDLGYEGACVTFSAAPYYEGRCNRKNPYGIKLKNFVDAEFVIEAVIEEIYHDADRNRKQCPELIGTGKGFAASFQCKPQPQFTDSFRAPLACTEAVARQYWAHRDSIIGQKCVVRWLDCGTVTRPRLPVCTGVRFDFALPSAD